jgi:hypothetical protein
LLAAAQAAHAKYDPVAGTAAVAAYRAGAKACGTANPGLQVLARVFSGTRKVGETCTTQLDCAQSSEGAVTCLVYSDSSGTSGSICQLHVTAREGDACGGAGDVSAPVTNDLCNVSATSPLRCDFTANKCASRVAVGGACGGNGDCIQGAYCGAGTCAPRIAVGESCAFGGAGGDPCSSGAYCLGTTGVCTAKKRPGEACTTTAATLGECMTSCCAGKCCALGLGNARVCVTG